MSLGPRRRVSYSQLEGLWDYLNQNRSLATGYNKTAQARELSKRMWHSIAEELNAHGDGATKDWRGWCKYWNDYKSKLKTRVAAARTSLHRTGGGPSNEQPLSDIELKFLRILGEDFGSGIPEARVEPFDVPLPVSHPSQQELQSSSELHQVFTEGPNIILEQIEAPSDQPLTPLPQTPRRSPRLMAQHTQILAGASPQLSPVPYAPTSASQVTPRQISHGTHQRQKQRQRRGEPHITQQAARAALIRDATERTNLAKQKLEVLKNLVEEIKELKVLLLTRLPLPATNAE